MAITLKFYEEELHMCELPGSSSNRALSEIICDHCGKKAHKKENCWQRKREEREAAKEAGKTRPPRDVENIKEKARREMRRGSPKAAKARTKEKGKVRTSTSKRKKERSACSICKQ